MKIFLLFLALYFFNIYSVFGQCTVNIVSPKNDTTICNGTQIILIASGTNIKSYVWSDKIKTDKDTINPTKTTTYTVTATDNASKTCTANIVITIPTVNAGKDTSICNGGNITLSATGVNIKSFSWSDGTPNNKSTINISPTQATTYIVTVTNTEGCTASDKVTVTVNPNPVADFTFDNNNQCSGTTITFTNQSSPTMGVFYKWNFGDKTTDIAKSPTHIYNAIGNGTSNFNVTLLDSTKFGCKSQKTLTITVKQKPDTSLINNSVALGDLPYTHCSSGGTSVYYLLKTRNTSTTKPTNTNYTIDWGDGSNVFSTTTFPNDTVSHGYKIIGIFTLTLTVNGQNLCTSITKYTVFNGSNPAIGIGNPGSTSGCLPSTYTFPITYTNSLGIPNPPGTTYSINVNDGSAPTIYTQSYPPQLPPANYTHIFNKASCGVMSINGTTFYNNSFQVAITAQNPCGSTSASVTPINISSDPKANLIVYPGLTGCINSPYTFQDSTIEGCYVYSNYTTSSSHMLNWSISPTTGWTITSGKLGNTNPDFSDPYTWGSTVLGVNFNTPGQYLITVKSENPCGPSTKTKTICINPLPISSFTINKNSFCTPDIVDFTNTSNTLTHCKPVTYLWEVFCTAGTCSPACLNFSFSGGTNKNSINPKISFTQTGTYTVRLTVNNGCTPVYSQQTITVKKKPEPIMTITPLTVCLGNNINASSTASNCLGTISSWNWTFQNGNPTSSTAQNPGNTSFTTIGTKTISLKVTNECGDSIITKNITVNPLPIITQKSNITVCPGDIINIGNFVSTPNGATFTWTNSNTNIGLLSSGLGNISTWTAPDNTTGSNITGSITVIPTLNNCQGTSMIFTITIKPKPITNSISALNFCPGDIIPTQNFSSNPTGATFTWTNSNSSIGIGTNGSANISSWTAPNNNGSTNITGNITVTPTLNSCVGNPMNYSINIYPKPIINTINNISVCPGNTIAIGSFSSTPLGASFIWTNSNTNIGLTANGNENISSWIAPDNNSGTDITATVSVTPTLNGCSGTPQTFTITLKSKPTLNTINNQTICSGQTTTAINMNSNISGSTYNWIPNINGSVSPNPGSGNANTIPATIFNNNNSTASIITYSVTPIANSCSGNLKTFTVTINPAPTVTNPNPIQSICSGGTAFAWNLTSSVSNTTFIWNTTAPTTLNGYLSNGGSSIGSQTITNNGNTIDTVTYTITPTGPSNSGFNCAGVVAKFKIAVYPIPVATASPSSQTICSGNATNIALTSNVTAGTGTSFAWTVSSNSNIIGAANGSGNTITQMLTNTSSSTQTITYTITPKANGCSGSPITVTITVNPKPIVSIITTPTNATICDNTLINIDLSSTNTSTSFAWSVNSPTGTSGATNGNGNTINQTLRNTTFNLQTINYIITPTANNCAGNPLTVPVYVKPTPDAIATVNPSSICMGDISNISISSSVSGASFAWIPNTNSNITGQTNGTGATIAQKLLNNTTTDQTLIYTITPAAAGCVGSGVTANIVVKPKPTIDAVSNQMICAGNPTTTTNFGSNINGTSFNWNVSLSGNITPTPTSGSGLSLITATLNNNGVTPGIANYTITPTLNGCNGTSTSFTITVNPAPSVTNTNLNQNICSGGSSTALNINSNISGTTFEWNASAPTTLKNYTPSGSGNIPIQTISTTSKNIDTVIYTITPTFSGTNFNCAGVVAKFKIAVYPIPVATASPSSQTICSGNATNIALTSNVTAGTGTSFAWTVSSNSNIIGAANGSGNTITQMLTNTSSSTQTITYTITPKANGCSGSPITVTITVNPKPIVSIITTPTNATICDNTLINIDLSSTNTSTSFAWSVNSPTGTSGATNGNGNTINQTLRNTTFNLQTINYIITPTANNCAGNPLTVPVYVKPTPDAIATVNPSSICMGDISNISISSSVSGASFAWIPNTNSNITGQTNGTGATIAQKLLNNTTTDQTLIYTITPTAAGCVGSVINTSILVHPKPKLTNNFINDTLCSNSTLNGFPLTSNVVGSNFSWYYISNPGITPTSGNGTSNLIPNITFNNSTTSTVNTTFIYKVFYSGCPGDSNSRIIVVKPRPSITNNPLTQTICSEDITSKITLNANIAGTTFTWTSSSLNGVTGFATSGTSIIPSQRLTYNGNAQGIVNYQITPSNNSTNLSCPGSNINYEILVNPKPTAAYTYTPSDGGSPLNVTFTNQSTIQPLNNIWIFSNHLPNLTSQNPIVSLTNTGNIDSIYRVTLIVSTPQNCGDTVYHDITVFPLPKVDFSFTDTCFGYKTQFKDLSKNTGSGINNNRKWDFGDGSPISTDLNPTHLYNQPGIYKVILTVTNSNNVSASKNKNVVVHSLPKVNFGFDTLACKGSSNVQFHDSSTIQNIQNDINTNWNWNFGDSQSSTLQNPSHIYLNTGFKQIKLIVSTNFGCTSSKDTTIHIIQKAFPDFIIQPYTKCADTLKINFTNNSIGYNFNNKWDFGNKKDSSKLITPPAITYYQSDTSFNNFYIVSLNVTNFCGDSILKDTVKFNSFPIANFGVAKNDSCSPFPVQMINKSKIADKYTWYFDKANLSDLYTTSKPDTITHIYKTDTATKEFIIRLKAENQCGIRFHEDTITVQPNTIKSFFEISKYEVCPGIKIDFINHSTDHDPIRKSKMTYFWNFGDTLKWRQLQNNTSHIYPDSNVYVTYTVQLIADNTCSRDTSNQKIIVDPNPNINFSFNANNSRCQYQPLLLSNLSQNNPIVAFTWSYLNNGKWLNFDPPYFIDTSGTYTIKLKGTSSIGEKCSDSITKNITINPAPIIDFNTTDTIGCQPFKLTITNNNSTANSFQWFIDPANNVFPPQSGFSKPTFIFNDSGIYSIKLIAKNNFNCRDTFVKNNIIVHPTPKITKLNLSATKMCGQDSTFIFSVDVNKKGTICDYCWDFLGRDSLDCINFNTSSVSYKYNFGTYPIEVSVTNEFHCNDKVYDTIKICHIPNQSAKVGPLLIGCPPFKINITDQSINTDLTIWDFGDSTQTDTTITSISKKIIYHTYYNPDYNSIKNYFIKLKSIGECGCSKESILNYPITVYPKVSANFDTIHSTDPPRQVLFNNQSINANTYIWNFGDNSRLCNDTNPVHQYNSYGKFPVTLIATDRKYNCHDTIVNYITIDKFWGLYVPNALEPQNADDLVNVFKPLGIGIKEYHLSIYDTWGNLIWETNKLLEKGIPAEGWNGRNKKGELLPQDVYVWFIEATFINGDNWDGTNFKNSMIRKQGTLTLIR